MRVRGLPFRLFHAACWHHLLDTLHRAPFGESAVASEIQLLLLPAPSPHAILHRQEIELDESTSDELDAAFSSLFLVVNQGSFSRTRVEELRWERERSASDACIAQKTPRSVCSTSLHDVCRPSRSLSLFPAFRVTSCSTLLFFLGFSSSRTCNLVRHVQCCYACFSYALQPTWCVHVLYLPPSRMANCAISIFRATLNFVRSSPPYFAFVPPSFRLGSCDFFAHCGPARWTWVVFLAISEASGVRTVRGKRGIDTAIISFQNVPGMFLCFRRDSRGREGERLSE